MTQEILTALKAIEDKLTRQPTSFLWTPAMEAIWPRDYRPTMSGLLAIWEAMQEAAEYSPVPANERPPYPEGDVVGPCVCGSWPGGKCLRCEWRPAADADGWIAHRPGDPAPSVGRTYDPIEYRMENGEVGVDPFYCLHWDKSWDEANIIAWRPAK